MSYRSAIAAGMKHCLTHMRTNARALPEFYRRRPRLLLAYSPSWVSIDLVAAYLLLVFLFFVLVDPLLLLAVRALPPESSRIFAWLTNFGASKWYITPAAVVFLLLGFLDWRSLRREMVVGFHTLACWAALFLVAIAGSGLSVNLLKRMIGRARPKYYDSLGSFSFDPFAFKSSFASFPSGHATTVGAMAVLLALFFPRWKMCWIIFALIIALSRVVIGSHYTADIVAGLGFGAAFSWVVIVFFARRRLGVQPDKLAAAGVAPRWPRKALSFGAMLQACYQALSGQTNRRLPPAHNLAMKQDNADRDKTQTNGKTND